MFSIVPWITAVLHEMFCFNETLLISVIREPVWTVVSVRQNCSFCCTNKRFLHGVLAKVTAFLLYVNQLLFIYRRIHAFTYCLSILYTRAFVKCRNRWHSLCWVEMRKNRRSNNPHRHRQFLILCRPSNRRRHRRARQPWVKRRGGSTKLWSVSAPSPGNSTSRLPTWKRRFHSISCSSWAQSPHGLLLCGGTWFPTSTSFHRDEVDTADCLWNYRAPRDHGRLPDKPYRS